MKTLFLISIVFLFSCNSTNDKFKAEMELISTTKDSLNRDNLKRTFAAGYYNGIRRTMSHDHATLEELMELAIADSARFAANVDRIYKK